MSPYLALKRIARLEPGTMLDIGARGCETARRFAELGYAVEAIDPARPEDPTALEGITFHQSTLEAFEAKRRYDLVVASLVSHLVRYDVPGFLGRLRELAKDDGLIYVTLLGGEDGWAGSARANALAFDKACALVEELELKPLYRSVEWFEGRVYSGEAKFWHLYSFVLARRETKGAP